MSADVFGVPLLPAGAPRQKILPEIYHLVQNALDRLFGLSSARLDRISSRTDSLLGRSDLRRDRLCFFVRLRARVYVGPRTWLPL